MRLDGLWHAGLVELVVSLRHHETLVLADAGLPVPAHVPTIDLGWARGEPRLLPVLHAILGELVVERAAIADETCDPGLLDGLLRELARIPVERTSHADLIARCAHARGVVRTGEATPFANVVLQAGVAFPRPGADR